MTNVPALPAAPTKPDYVLNLTKNTDSSANYEFTVDGDVVAHGAGGWDDTTP